MKCQNLFSGKKNKKIIQNVVSDSVPKVRESTLNNTDQGLHCLPLVLVLGQIYR